MFVLAEPTVNRKTLQVSISMPDAPSDQLLLGRALLALRKRAGMTQSEVAERAGTDDTHVSRVERGQFDVRWTTSRRLLEALGADMHQLADALVEVEQQDPPSKR
jgi:transcriptional regulator with XRE-family HTH domain